MAELFYVGLSHQRPSSFSAADSEWRVAFAFDTKHKAVLLVAGDKCGGGKRSYKQLIAKADDRFDAHFARLKKKERK